MRGPKKSETIEIRLPYAAKQAFMARCKDRGVSASQALRAFIDGEAPAPRRTMPLRWIAGGLAVLALGAIAAPSLARPSIQSEFARMDADHDGSLSLSEFEASASVRVSPGPAVSVASSPTRDALLAEQFGHIDADRNGRITLDELRRAIR